MQHYADRAACYRLLVTTFETNSCWKNVQYFCNDTIIVTNREIFSCSGEVQIGSSIMKWAVAGGKWSHPFYRQQRVTYYFCSQQHGDVQAATTLRSIFYNSLFKINWCLFKMYPEAPKMLIIIEINHDINKYHYNVSILIFFSFTGANFYLIILCFFSPSL